ncbi:MAG TPA: homoserine dehydrogenase [Anaerolineae bacterium]|nr:homoserine dehydrogenase [Anaerolineae bacterium]
MQFDLCLLGFGNVGRELVKLIERKREELTSRYDLELRIVGIATGRHGIVMRREGIDAHAALDDWDRLLSASPAVPDALTLIRECGAQATVEMTPIDRETGRPAIDHVEAALSAGQHAISANKGPLAYAYRHLRDLAARKRRAFLFEATVMDGFPIFNLYRECLPATSVLGFRGVLNSTTNLILTKMEEGMSFDDAVRHAQDIGIAETDPSNDIDGWDSAVKVSVLCNVMMDADIRPQQVERTGIRNVTIERIRAAHSRGRKIRLICSAERREGRLVTRVAPEEVGPDDIAHRLRGTTSMLSIRTDTLNQLTLLETAPTPAQTAFGVLADIVAAARGHF